MILAIESSCDESAVAVFDPSRGLVGEWLHSQIAVHERFGGVVPDLATREHLRALGPLLERAATEVDLRAINRVAVTQGPGLAGCLALGVAAAKALALGWGVPLVGVNHLRGHVFSPFIPLHAESPAEFEQRLDALLPHLGLVVSGGNTLLVRVDRERRVTLISTTKDDAAGEAFDKGAKLLGLGYPGGPLVERHAQNGRRDAYDFPKGIGPRSDLDFSFSGLKTSLRYTLEKMSVEGVRAALPDLCASYQHAIIEALVRKTGLAAGRDGFRSVGLSGGVSNNRTLRLAFERLAKELSLPFLPALSKHTGDNAGMIAFAAWVDPAADAESGPALSIAPNLAVAGAGGRGEGS